MDTPSRPRRPTLIVALLVLALVLLALALRPQAARAPASPGPSATATPTASTTPPPPSPTSAPSPTPAPQLALETSTSPLTITFGLHLARCRAAQTRRCSGTTPPPATPYGTSRSAARRRSAPASRSRQRSEGLTVTEALSDELDFWWAIRDEGSIVARRAGSIALPPVLAEIAQTAPITAPMQLDWVERATPHFRLLAPPGSAAARDLGQLAEVAEASFGQASRVITTTQPISIPVYLVPRVFWQGGVAYGDGGIAISYLDRNYTGVENWSYFVHEVTHALSSVVLPRGAEIGGLLGEGVAVYATGGHYSLAPIDAWAAVLAESERYVPLCQLRYDFYAAQHEVAYQQGASFSGYLIRSYGLEAFRQIYAAQQPQRGDHDIDIATFCDEDNRRIVAPTGKTAGQLEQDWLSYLKSISPTDEQRRTWELTVRFFDTMRRYQERFDLPARDLPPRPDTWDRATAAKFLNAAAGQRAMMLETMLSAVQPAIRRGDPAQAEALLGAIEASIDDAGAANSPLSRDYDAIVELLAAQARAYALATPARWGSPWRCPPSPSGCR